MDSLFPLDVLFRWLHIGTAIVVVGGTVFLRFVLLPAADSLSESEHRTLSERLTGRWKSIVHIGILLFLLSGFYNFFRALSDHRGDSLYHALMGTKILLAFVVFFLASVLVGRSAKFDRLRQNRRTWLAVIILLTATIVALSGFLKVRRFPATEAASVTAPSSVSNCG